MCRFIWIQYIVRAVPPARSFSSRGALAPCVSFRWIPRVSCRTCWAPQICKISQRITDTCFHQAYSDCCQKEDDGIVKSECLLHCHGLPETQYLISSSDLLLVCEGTSGDVFPHTLIPYYLPLFIIRILLRHLPRPAVSLRRCHLWSRIPPLIPLHPATRPPGGSALRLL